MNLNWQEGERLIVHKGLSSPICPHAETSQLVARQSADGFQTISPYIILAVLDARNQIKLKVLNRQENIQVKNYGEENAILQASAAPFGNWWCNVHEIQGVHFGLVGRPNRHRIRPQYQIPMPHIISTTQWKRALEALLKDKNLHEEILSEERQRKHPLLAAEYDILRNSITGEHLNPHGTNWVHQC